MVVTLLAIGSVLLTFIGTYRFTSYFFPGDSVLALLISSMTALIYISLFSVITLVLGVLTITLPVWYLLARTNLLNIDALRQTETYKSLSQKDGSNKKGSNKRVCPDCGKEQAANQQYCISCGSNMGTKRYQR